MSLSQPSWRWIEAPDIPGLPLSCSPLPGVVVHVAFQPHHDRWLWAVAFDQPQHGATWGHRGSLEMAKEAAVEAVEKLRRFGVVSTEAAEPH